MHHSRLPLKHDDLVASYIPTASNVTGYVRYWNSATMTPWLYSVADQAMITYEDAQSVGVKTDYIKAKGLGGVYFWEVSTDSSNALLGGLVGTLK